MYPAAESEWFIKSHYLTECIFTLAATCGCQSLQLYMKTNQMSADTKRTTNDTRRILVHAA